VKRHLTDDALLLLANGQLAANFEQSANDHLRECQGCRRRLEKTQKVRAVWARVSEQGLATALHTGAGVANRARPAVAKLRAPWAPISAAVTSAVVICVALFSSRTVPTVSAQELLTQAAQTQANFSHPMSFRIQVRGVSCGLGRSDSLSMSREIATSCVGPLSLFQKTPWGVGNPLSAQTFIAWQGTLGKHRDSVTRLDSSWRVSTTASLGAVQEADLFLGFADYRPLSLHLKFTDEEELTVAEEPESAFAASASAPPAVVSKPAHPAQPVRPPDDPADVLEVQAWRTLQTLQADSGWEASVSRTGAEVFVKSISGDSIRREEFAAAFRNYPAIKIEAPPGSANTLVDFLPPRALRGDSPALAQSWLEEQFPDHDARNRYTNTTADLSRAVLGRAAFLEQLKARQEGLQQCSCAPAMTKLIEQETIRLNEAKASLKAALEPLLPDAADPVPQPKRKKSAKPATLSYADAQRLDATVSSLLTAASSQDTLSYEDALALVRQLL
jgi:hypothetical protein